ncbi:FecR domain-containing protein [uncultured Chitinophaga sp.]|jgi:Fe2+-dicitrate sensor, membrane component|uniref:FecR family protein n=1 Tax=uncultured Chitinophaga sp. TaxID=339340 RepID=UPI002604CBD4|nr:FecR domain-containing protein [uncultured Chitinophaga sp.]
MNDKPFDHQLLINFIDGTASETEQQQVLAWINSDAANKELYFRVKDILDHQRAAGISPQDIRAQWQQVQQALAPRPRRSAWLKYAAILLVAIGVAVYFFYPETSRRILVKLSLTDSARMILLPDSSLVWLSPGSELQYDGRAARIKGTGYFDVKAHADKAFTVQTQRMKVTVLGTSFVVREDDRRSAVVVSSGAVKVNGPQQTTTLHPNEQWLLEDGRSRKEQVNAALYTAWKEDDPYLQNTSLSDITDMLSLIYGYTISIEKPEQLKTQTFSGRISLKDKPELWNTLSVMYNVTILKNERHITIQPK